MERSGVARQDFAPGRELRSRESGCGSSGDSLLPTSLVVRRWENRASSSRSLPYKSVMDQCRCSGRSRPSQATRLHWTHKHVFSSIELRGISCRRQPANDSGKLEHRNRAEHRNAISSRGALSCVGHNFKLRLSAFRARAKGCIR
jgi:hypothetical protein